MELGCYRYPDLKRDHEEVPTEIDACTVLVSAASDAADTLAPHIARAQFSASGVMRARDLANAPGNVLTPARMADIAHEIGTAAGMHVRSLDRAELEQEGFGGLLAVGQGSTQEPRFIIMDYTPAGDAATYPTICLVGKGITFDTGGISLKPGANMDNMKMDMGGAAAVLGTMQAIGAWQPPLRIVALISAAENMPGGNAFKPGDVITTLSGKTVEVLNTDAEGRVVLADALAYARRYEPTAVIDLATLTGAASIALGPHASAVLGTDQTLVDRLCAAGDECGERLWQLPLWDEYREMVKSEIADVRNTGGGREAGTITAAAFLAAFAGEMPWAHLDIAATAWVRGEPRAYQTRGATGVGVRVLLHFLHNWVQQSEGNV
jgi:leucyl aminopeptidase